ncbi:WD40-repeat-containing domain protein [Peziza echinospora]|nr:WD40-repeat-containing domain protein [Peziza echinospora]
MAAPITPIAPAKLPTHSSAGANPEQRFWHSFKAPLLINDYAAISHIHFSPLSPHDFAITSSTRVQIFSSKTRKVTKTISRFKDVAYSGHVRQDGKLLVAGDALGTIQVFDLNSRAILKTWSSHKQPVHVTKWSPVSVTTVLSASDDSTVRLWDLPTGEILNTFIGHQDYVRNAAFLPGGGGGGAGAMVVSGGYDGTVRLWDPRVPSSSTDDPEARGSAVMTLTHPHPIDSLLPMPSGTTILAGAGPIVHVWDIIAAKPLVQLANHQKTVTALAFTQNSSLASDPSTSAGGSSSSTRRVISGSLDGHVKVYDTTSWKVVHGIKYPAPILSLGISPEEKHLVVGMHNGLLSIRTRTSGKEKVTSKKKEKEMSLLLAGLPAEALSSSKKQSAATQRRLRGTNYKGDDQLTSAAATIVVDDRAAAPRLQPWEKDLRKLKYAEALDRVLTAKTPALTTLTVLLTLKHRSALRTALSNRDEATLAPVIKWLTKHIHRPEYVEVIVDVAMLVWEMYAHAVGQSPVVDELLVRMKNKVREEVGQSMLACKIGGMVGMLVGGGGAAAGGLAVNGAGSTDFPASPLPIEA